MKNILTVLCTVLFLISCVELPNLLPNSPDEPEDMLIIDLQQTLITPFGYTQYPDTFVINDSIKILVTLTNPNTTCSEIKIGVKNGQILKGFTSNRYYGGLNNGALLGNTTIGSWEPNYLITDQIPVSAQCRNDHLIVRNKDVYLGCRIQFSDNQWHYGWMILSVQDLFLGSDQILVIKKFGINKNAGVNARIGG